MPVNRHPSKKELAWFGLALGCFFGILGGMVLWRTGSFTVPRILWIVGGTLVATYYLVPPVRRPIFVGWGHLTFPIGWTLTHLVLALIYYGLITPAGLVMRLVGRDPMGRRFDPEASTYWVERPATPEPGRYFRQY